MKFTKCQVKTARLNMATSEITISFSMDYNEPNLETAVALSQYIDEKRGKVEVQVIPDQPPLQELFPAGTELVTKEGKK